MLTRIRTTLFLALLFAALPLAVTAGGDPAGRPDAGHRDFEMVAHVLQLDEQQVHEWHRIVRQTQGAIEPLHQELLRLNRRLEELLAEEEPDPTAVGELVVRRQETSGEIRSLQQEMSRRLKATLEPDQLERLERVEEAARLCRVVPAFRSLGLL